MKVFIPDDTSAISAGANRVASAFANVKDAQVVLTSSRGAFFLEPLVEVDTPQGRAGYANVTPAQVPALLKKKPTPISKIPFLAKQTRFTFANAGVTDPLSVETNGFAAGRN